jgi:hypothetical protein
MSGPLDADQRSALATALAQLERATLPDWRWREADELVSTLTTALGGRDREAIDRLVTEVSIAGFQAQVTHRLGGQRHRAPAVVPTKATPMLPAVGVVCAVGIGALGFALGGGILAAGTKLLALFVLGVALAGTRSASSRRAGAASRSDRADEHRAATPDERARLEGLRSLVQGAP